MTFFRKMCRGVCLTALVCAMVWLGTAAADRIMLREKIIRLHVVAVSDSEVDQKNKLLVRDTVLEYLNEKMDGAVSAQEAGEYIAQSLDEIREKAEDCLRRAGSSEKVTVRFCREAFARRDYESFSLPAGVYSALRLTIGAGEGRNWWCVIFPQFCTGASGFRSAATGAGFSDSAADSLEGSGGKVRFYILEKLGELENILFFGQ